MNIRADLLTEAVIYYSNFLYQLVLNHEILLIVGNINLQ